MVGWALAETNRDQLDEAIAVLEDAIVKDVTTRLAVFFAPFLMSGMALGSQQDAARVAALDTQYQAAVKSNDYATMGRILANDFVLVIGTGHVYRKADLIGYARKASSKWQHQEEFDGSQTVHEWGNTAVVTAKLWIKGLSRAAPWI